jgi:S1 RNA binding domain protein
MYNNGRENIERKIFFMSLKAGAIVDGTVKTITSFGAFIDLGDGLTGLVHISEISDDYVKTVTDYLEEQQKVKVKILSIDEENKKITLSIKKAESFQKIQPKQADLSFEDRLSKFLKDSEERQTSVKRSFENKRGGNRR